MRMERDGQAFLAVYNGAETFVSHAVVGLYRIGKWPIKRHLRTIRH
jgi:hypothetical protein